MPEQDFIECARDTLGDVVDAWDEAVLQPLIEIAEWYNDQSGVVQTIFAEVIGAAGTAAIEWIAAVVGVAVGDLLLPILGAFAAGVGIGTGLVVVAECAGTL